MFHDNLAGIQWVKMMCVCSVKESTDYSPILTVLTFFYTLGGVAQNLSGNHTHSEPVFEQGHLKLYPDMSH